MKLVTFGMDNDRNRNTISSIHTAIHTAAACIISDRDSTSSNYRPLYTSSLLHTSTGR